MYAFTPFYSLTRTSFFCAFISCLSVACNSSGDKQISTGINPNSIHPTAKPLYGNDNRIELVSAGRSLCNAGSTVTAILPLSFLEPAAGSDKNWILKNSPRLTDAGWCPSERFASQPSAVHCSGFLISPDRLVTAAHCVNDIDDHRGPALNCEDIALVFDHRLNANGQLPEQYTQDQVYFCNRVLAGEDTVTNRDWRIIELDRKTDRQPLPVLTNLPVNLPDFSINLVGHPMGLPLKASTRGSMNGFDTDGFFLANIDAFEGNSGSPVLIEHNGRSIVIGMLIRGEVDHEFKEPLQCKLSRVCVDTHCLGEKAMTTHAFAGWSSNQTNSLEIVSEKAGNNSLCF